MTGVVMEKHYQQLISNITVNLIYHNPFVTSFLGDVSPKGDNDNVDFRLCGFA